MGGAPEAPELVPQPQADPDAEIQVQADTFPVTARTATGRREAAPVGDHQRGLAELRRVPVADRPGDPRRRADAQGALMPVSKPADLPKGGDGRWPLCGHGLSSVRWGDLEVGYTVAEPVDVTAMYEGLPGGVCPCPHYGYVFAGRLRCTYPGTDWPDEVAEAGDVYFFPAGHVLVYEESSEVLELNPRGRAERRDGPHRGAGEAAVATLDADA